LSLQKLIKNFKFCEIARPLYVCEIRTPGWGFEEQWGGPDGSDIDNTSGQPLKTVVFCTWLHEKRLRVNSESDHVVQGSLTRYPLA